MTTPPKTTDPGGEFTDEKVRRMLSRAGFEVEIHDDVASFARFMRFMFADYEARHRSKDTKRTVYIALGVGTFTTMIPIILKLLKVL